MANEQNDKTRTIQLRAQILTVGEGRIIFKLSGIEQHLSVPASQDDERWAGARIYHHVSLDVTIGPGR